MGLPQSVYPTGSAEHSYEVLKCFQGGARQCKGVKAHLHVQADAIPKCHRPRSIPLSMKEKVEAELERKEKLGILEKIEIP